VRPRTVHIVGREVWRPGFRTFRKHRRPCGQPAVSGEIARFRPVPPQAGHLIWINAMPSVLPFSSTGFATYPEPPHFGQSSGATPLPLIIEQIFYDFGRNRAEDSFALRKPNKLPSPIPCAGSKADPGFLLTLAECSGFLESRWTGTESRFASYRFSFRLEVVAAPRIS
jgi:hypothetical protein